MYDYELVPDVRVEEFPHVCKTEQSNGWAVEQVFQRTTERDEVLYNIVFKKASKDINYGQMLLNRYSGKLKEVADKLHAAQGMSGIETAALARDVKEFLFKGSPDDM